MHKTNRKEINTIVMLIISLAIVGLAAKAMVLMRDHFEDTNKVMAETLPTLPNNILRNQISNIINDGYLTDNYAYSAE